MEKGQCSKETVAVSATTRQSMWQALSAFDLMHSSHVNSKKYCQVVNTAQQCGSRLFQDCDFAGDLEDSKSTSGGLLCIFGSHTFVPMSRMCKKQTSVSRRSTEAEVISLDAGSRMDGCKFTHGWNSQLLTFGIWLFSFPFFPEPTNNTKDQVRGNSSRNTA